eukprot:scaffold12961_cov56-Cyclotella_meneghiniana.AAC.1
MDEFVVPIILTSEAIVADSRWPLAMFQPPPIGHRMMTKGGWGVAVGSAEEIQPPFGSSLWLVRIQRQFLTFARRSTSSSLFKTKRFHRNIRYVMSDVSMKALGDATLGY